ncbi:hypothetical protein J6590_037656 [Homalodisca vitripennis]|nr:hypothetical protein J6590_037656 [Homalodisca vitripennis]
MDLERRPPLPPTSPIQNILSLQKQRRAFCWWLCEANRSGIINPLQGRMTHIDNSRPFDKQLKYEGMSTICEIALKTGKGYNMALTIQQGGMIQLGNNCHPVDKQLQYDTMLTLHEKVLYMGKDIVGGCEGVKLTDQASSIHSRVE